MNAWYLKMLIHSDEYPLDEFGKPMRGDKEDWIHYHRRWWDYWIQEDLKLKSRAELAKRCETLRSKKMRGAT